MPDAVDRGLALLEQRQYPDALRVLGREARNNRLDADAQNGYGLALHRSGQYAEAVEQFLRADRLKPNRWQLWQNLSAAYHGLEQYEDAYAATLRVLEMKPDYHHALQHLADLHLIWGEMPEAVDYYDRVLQTDPTDSEAWVGKMFALDLIPGVTPAQALEARQAYARTFETQAAPHRMPHFNRPDPDRRLRIGYISGDFRDHTAAYMFGPLYQYHDRDRFQVFSYSAVKRDYVDGVVAWFRSASNAWRQIDDCAVRDVVAQIRADQIDILVDTAGYTNGGQLPVFAFKPAPLQVQAFGYLTGSGLTTMDAILVDDILVPPEHEWHFSERPLRVPYALGMAWSNGDVPITPKPDGAPLTFGHLGRADKVSAQGVALWARVLRAYPESRMVLKDRGYRLERTTERIVGWFAAEGIGRERLEIRGATGRGEHMASYNEVDVILDSLPQGGGSTTMEAVFMGTPVVTMLGPRIIGRIAGTTIHAIGRDRWIAADEDEYVRLAGTVVADGGPHLRDEIMGSVVADGQARTRAFEDAVRDLWRQWCRAQTVAA